METLDAAADETGARWFAAASTDDVPENGVIAALVEGHEIALYNLSGAFYATSNVCTHGQSYLSDGWVTENCQIECPLHAGCFDIRSGKGMGPPIEEDLRTYTVKVEAGTIFVALPD
jgi:naphthalene 1,2-dioxygenase system ferredoxin subunit